MTVIPAGFAQITQVLAGLNAPNGAAVVYGVQNVGDDPAEVVAETNFVNFSPVVTNCCTSDIQLISTIAKLGPNDTGPMAEFADTAVPGAVGGTSVSPGSAYLIRKNSALGGRRGRGRTYLPGVYDNGIDDSGNVDAGILAALNLRFNDLLTALASFGTPMVLLHSYPTHWELVGGQPRRIEDVGPIPVPTMVTSMAADTRIATQRRRLR